MPSTSEPPETSPGDVAWHQALVFALLGERRPELGRQPSPDLDALEQWFGDDQRVDTARQRATQRRRSGESWPYPAPADLAVPAAQFAAGLYALRTRLGLIGAVTPPTPARTLTTDEQRLLRDVPPHHGG